MRAFWIVLTTLLAVGAAGAFFWWPRPQSKPAVPAADAVVDPEARPAVVLGKSYYVLLSLIEVGPKKPGGKRWDGDGSAPDLYYAVSWQGQKIFRSAKKADTLVAKWSNVSVDWKSLVNEVSLDDSIKAARVTVREGQTLSFAVFDADLVRDDPVGDWQVPLTQLKVGDQVFDKPGGSLVQVHCRVLPLDKVEFASLVK